jgi:hypothetical protein
MFTQKKITYVAYKRSSAPLPERRREYQIDAYVDESLDIATFQVPTFTSLYRWNPEVWLFWVPSTTRSIQVFPYPANKETAIMFAEQMASRGWDEPVELATYWMEYGIGEWVMPVEEVRNA